MNLASKVSVVALLFFLCLAPLSTMGAEESEAGVTTVTEHNELCLDVNTTSFDSGYYVTTFDLDEVNNSMTLDFDAEVLNVTKNGTTVSSYDIIWSFFQFSASDEVLTSTNNSIEAHDLSLQSGMDQVQIFWEINLESTDSVNIDEICIDAVFTLEVEAAEEHGEKMGDMSLGNLALTLIFTLSIPIIVLVIFNKVV